MRLKEAKVRGKQVVLVLVAEPAEVVNIARVAGPIADICDECIGLCVDILDGNVDCDGEEEL